MKKAIIHRSIFFGEAILKSYSQVFFAESKILATILLVVSFLDWWIGLSGLIAVLISIVLAEILGYDSITIRKGLFSFNSLLVGLGIGTYFLPGPEVLLLLIIGSAFAFFATVLLMGILAKYGLPFLSFPFLIGIWLLLLAFPAFTGIELNADALFPSNMLHRLGGNFLVNIVDFLHATFLHTGLDTYFLSLGAIFFQFNMLAGVLIAIGLLIHSRIHFLFSVFGFFVAYWFYSFFGMYSGTLNYTYYGFNFILSAIAIGGYFLIPSRQSFLWSMFLIPVLVVTTIGSARLFSFFDLSVFSLPFNVVVIGVLYAFKIRYDQTRPPILTYIQQRNPETNAYLFNSQSAKEFTSYTFPIRLPFIGKWTVNQGHDGKFTHKDFYKYSWDFVINDPASAKEFEKGGLRLADYFCFNKPVTAPAPGVVVAVVNNVDDNEVGQTNTLQNWGNTVVIKHGPYLYSKLCHLKKGSVEVSINETVSEGQEIGKCGNSGRSPYPHLHFQLQTSPTIGSPSILYPLSDFIADQKAHPQFFTKGIPKENDSVNNIQVSSLLHNAFKWNPGDHFELDFIKKKTLTYSIINEVDSNNQSYLHCLKSNAKLYYSNNGKIFTALNYAGSQKSPLFYFYSALYQVVFSHENTLSVTSRFPVHHIYRFPLITLQDFLIPFGFFLKGNYQLHYKEAEEVFNQKEVKLHSSLSGINNKVLFSSRITVNKNKGIKFSVKSPDAKIELRWSKKLD